MLSAESLGAAAPAAIGKIMRIEPAATGLQRRLDDGAGRILAVVRPGRHGLRGRIPELGAAQAGGGRCHAPELKPSPSPALSDKHANAAMKRLALLLLALPACLLAQVDDPLKSPACAQALATLDATRAAAAPQADVATSRDRAAQACLGGGAMPGRNARVMQAPVTVAPPVIAPPAPGTAPLTAAQPRLPAAPVVISRPPAPAHCDAGGCWADDGRGLRHVGPNLAGPGGPCVKQAGQVLCR